MKEIVVILIVALLIAGCSGGIDEEKIIGEFLNSSCGESTMSHGIAMDAINELGSGAHSISPYAFKDGDGYAVRITFANAGQTVKYAYNWIPGTEEEKAKLGDRFAGRKYPENPEAERVGRKCRGE